MHQALTALYDEMMPLCEGMSNIARALAGIGTFLFIAFRIFRTMADGERIEILPLLRPLGICLLIAFFPTLVLGTINGILGTISRGTESMLEKETFSMAEFRKAQEAAERKAYAEDPDLAYMESDEAFDRELESLGWSPSDLLHMAGMFYENAIYALERMIRTIISAIMEFIFDSSSLIIDTIRTFYLVVLSILGPISFALSVWKGFESSMGFWISRYIQVYLWLPICNLFSCILLRLQILMVQNNIADTDGNWIYALFLAIGSIGYFCVPTVSQWIVQAGGEGSFQNAVNTVTIATIKSPYTIPNKIHDGIKKIRGNKKGKKEKNDTGKS